MLNDHDSDEEPTHSGLRSHQSDAELVKRILSGDRLAFDEFVNEVLPVVHRFATSRLRSDPEVVRDVVQSTLCKAIESLSRYRGEGALLSWVCGICRFEIFAVYKDRRRESVAQFFEESVEVEQALARMGSPVDPEKNLVEQEVRSLVHLTLDSLPSDYGKLLEMKYSQNRSVREMARVLDRSEKAVESGLTRAREAFKSNYPLIVRDVGGGIKG